MRNKLYTIEIVAERRTSCYSLYVPGVLWHTRWTFSTDICFQNWRRNILLKTAPRFVPVIDCQCRDKDLIASQTTVITPLKFKFTFAPSSTWFVPKLTGGV